MATYIRYLVGLFMVRTGLASRQRGATLIEYVLIVAVIAVAVFLGATFGLVSAITGIFSDATSAMNDAA